MSETFTPPSSPDFVNVENLPLYKVLYCLWLYSIDIGKSSKQIYVPTAQDCQNEIELNAKYRQSVDYFAGRIIKTDFNRIENNELEIRLYDRDNGKGTAQNAINRLRKEPNIIYI